MKSGQIAHLDKDNSNNSEDNLAFICLNHHDEYDSSSSQRKNFTIGEVKIFRDELYVAVASGFSQPVHFGEIVTSPIDPYAGTWIRSDVADDSAQITLTPLPDSFFGDVQYYVKGLALSGLEREFGPNTGELEFLGKMRINSRIEHIHYYDGDNRPSTSLVFHGDGTLEVSEFNCFGVYGWGVTFNGNYRRAH